jgi:hypothetical protein
MAIQSVMVYSTARDPGAPRSRAQAVTNSGTSRDAPPTRTPLTNVRRVVSWSIGWSMILRARAGRGGVDGGANAHDVTHRHRFVTWPAISTSAGEGRFRGTPSTRRAPLQAWDG